MKTKQAKEKKSQFGEICKRQKKYILKSYHHTVMTETNFGKKSSTFLVDNKLGLENKDLKI